MSVSLTVIYIYDNDTSRMVNFQTGFCFSSVQNASTRMWHWSFKMWSPPPYKSKATTLVGSRTSSCEYLEFHWEVIHIWNVDGASFVISVSYSLVSCMISVSYSVLWSVPVIVLCLLLHYVHVVCVCVRACVRVSVCVWCQYCFSLASPITLKA